MNYIQFENKKKREYKQHNPCQTDELRTVVICIKTSGD